MTRRLRPTKLPPYLWASPCTAVGYAIGLVLVAFGARVRHVSGVLEFAFDTSCRPVPRWVERLPFVAITFGHVVLATTHDCHTEMRAHERVHVRQYERWGALMLVLYPASSVWQWLRGRDVYWDNAFEVQARRLAP